MSAPNNQRHPNLRRALIGLPIVIAGLFSVPSVSAGQPDSVDPARMQPALNPAFAPWTCWRADDRIICEGSKTETYASLQVDFLSCAAGPIYSQGTFTSTARRVGDAEGRALETSFRDRYDEYFITDSGGADPQLRSIGRLQHSFSYGVPGDPSTVSETLAGMAISVTGPGFGVVMHEVGTVAWDNNGDLVRFGGVHPFAVSSEQWEETHDRICAAMRRNS
jgi:hypothetical protein